MKPKTTTSRAQQLIIPIVAILLVIASANAMAALAGDGTTINIAPSSGSVDTGETTTFTVAVNNVNGGVGAGEMAVVVGDPSVATITDVAVLGSGVETVHIAEDGSSANVDYAARNTSDSGNVSIMEVTVEGQSSGETSLSLEATDQWDDILLFDEDNIQYELSDTSGATITVDESAPAESSSTSSAQTETPTETPSAETSSTEAPSTEAPTETPVPNAPSTEAPTETPSTEELSSETESEPAPETKLHIHSRKTNIGPGKTTTHEVIVDNADGGVGAGEMAIVVGDPDVATITDVTVMGSGDEQIDIGENGSRADIQYDSRDTYDSGYFPILEVTVEGQSNGETSLSIEAANGSDDVLLFDESGTTYNITETTGTTLNVGSVGTKSKPPADEPDAFQIDLVQGAVIEQFDPDEGITYHKQDRFITALHITGDEDHAGGPGSPMSRTYQSDGCEVTYSWLSFNSDTGESQVVVSVSDVEGCEGITLSYAGYQLPDGSSGWDSRADEQELKDSVTVTLQPGDEETLTIDVTPSETSSA